VTPEPNSPVENVSSEPVESPVLSENSILPNQTNQSIQNMPTASLDESVEDESEEKSL
jgi:hypothetical protein